MATATTYGIWTEATPNPPQLVGLNTKEIKWGFPAASGGRQSGYRFEGVNNITLPLDGTEFVLGTFSHLNFPINVGTSTTSAQLLKLTIEPTFRIGERFGEGCF